MASQPEGLPFLFTIYRSFSKKKFTVWGMQFDSSSEIFHSFYRPGCDELENCSFWKRDRWSWHVRRMGKERLLFRCNPLHVLEKYFRKVFLFFNFTAAFLLAWSGSSMIIASNYASSTALWLWNGRSGISFISCDCSPEFNLAKHRLQTLLF